MKKIIFTLLLLLPSTFLYAQSIKVESSGIYTGPIQTKAPPVVVELFSSQNCPACPPADEYMAELSKMDGVIALSCHVDYFGKTSAGLGKPICTQRQSRYIKQIGRKAHFTPQMMINGHMSEIGYETSAVAASVVKARSENILPIVITQKSDGVYNFNLSAQRVNGPVEIWVAVYQKPKAIQERGKMVTYSNVMKNYLSLGIWEGEAFTKVISPITDSQSAGFAVVAQEVKSGKILAAANYPL